LDVESSKKIDRAQHGEKRGEKRERKVKGKESWLGQNSNPKTDVADDTAPNVSPPPVAKRRTAAPRIVEPRTTTQEFGLFIVNISQMLESPIVHWCAFLKPTYEYLLML
jgi:hypothetical protein